MYLLMMMAAVTLLVGSHAIKCYQCENMIEPASKNVKGKKCFDPTLPMPTCEASTYCSKLEFTCPAGIVFIVT